MVLINLTRSSISNNRDASDVAFNETMYPSLLEQHSPKIQQIRDIWAAGLGVVSLHIFQSVIPVEAYTREACMIDALGKFILCKTKAWTWCNIVCSCIFIPMCCIRNRKVPEFKGYFCSVLFLFLRATACSVCGPKL